MRILAIETSCDETAISFVELNDTHGGVGVIIRGNELLSQVALHEPYGGVYPNLAKREHSKNLTPILISVLKQANEYTKIIQPLSPQDIVTLQTYLKREPELFAGLIKLLTALKRPNIDAIAVTSGPGLEPALWVGINAAKALCHVWNIPLVPVNHMEGHVFSSLLTQKEGNRYLLPKVNLPAVALLISGGHTELVLIKEKSEYVLLGSTRDDAVGEAFDKVARMLSLPYPGGPKISKYAQAAHARNATPVDFPRPMLKANNFDFSFSGLKTAVRYYIETLPEITETAREEIALGFENAVTDVLLAKTLRALTIHHAKTFIMGGGVSANAHIRSTFSKAIRSDLPEVTTCIPDLELTTDNAVMIAIAAYHKQEKIDAAALESIRAEGNLKLH